MKQGRASRDVDEGWKKEPRPYAINQNFPSQLGSAIDPFAAEKMRDGPGYSAPGMVTDGMGQGPGANRDGGTAGSPIRKAGAQGRY